jgi:hypothetical protein
MRLPNAQEARIDRNKIAGYLLCRTHPDGKSKADFFGRFGFTSTKWEVFAEAMRIHAQKNETTKCVETGHGKRNSIDGTLEVPDGRRPMVRTVWIVETGKTAPRLITAHPVQKREE